MSGLSPGESSLSFRNLAVPLDYAQAQPTAQGASWLTRSYAMRGVMGDERGALARNPGTKPSAKPHAIAAKAEEGEAGEGWSLIIDGR